MREQARARDLSAPTPAQTRRRRPARVLSNTATDLELTFLIMLVALGAAAVFLAHARTTRAGDLATAAASHDGGNAPRTPPGVIDDGRGAWPLRPAIAEVRPRGERDAAGVGCRT